MERGGALASAAVSRVQAAGAGANAYACANESVAGAADGLRKTPRTNEPNSKSGVVAALEFGFGFLQEFEELGWARELLPLSTGEVDQSFGRHFHLGFQVIPEDEADPTGDERLHDALQGSSGDRAGDRHGFDQ